MADSTVTIVGNVTRDPEIRYTAERRRQGVVRRRGEPPVAEPQHPGVGGADQLLQRRVLARHGRERRRVASGKAPASSSAAGSSSAPGRPRTARSAASSRSSPTRSARACAGRPRRSPQRAPRRRRRWRRRFDGGSGAAAAVRRRPAPAPAAEQPAASRDDDSARSPSETDGTRPRTDHRKRPPRRRRIASPRRRCRSSTASRITWVDYKDVNLLRRFMSERAKIRARRVTGNDAQQQRAVARAIRVAREMALLPYSVRQVTHRSKGKGRGDRGDRDSSGPPPRSRDRPAHPTTTADDATTQPATEAPSVAERDRRGPGRRRTTTVETAGGAT